MLMSLVLSLQSPSVNLLEIMCIIWMTVHAVLESKPILEAGIRFDLDNT